jgi:hypothetical protein
VVPATTRSSGTRPRAGPWSGSDVLAVDIADARRADRAHEGHARDRQRGRGRRPSRRCRDRSPGRGPARCDDQRLVAKPSREQRADRAVDQARGQGLLLGRRPSRLKKPPGILPAAKAFSW